MWSSSEQGGITAGPELRPYQREAVAAVEVEFAAGRKSTLLVQATGTGKTVGFAELIRRWVAGGDRSLVVAHRTELLDQAARKLADVGVRAEIDQGDRRASSSAMVVVASVQTLRGARLLRYPRGWFRKVVVDEAHHAAAAGYQNILEHCEDAQVLGVTATPKRLDGKALGDTFQSVAFTYDLRQAIAEQYLVPIVARRVRVADLDLTRVKTVRGDLDPVELARILSAEKQLHAMVSPLVELVGRRKAIVFCVDVAHAKAVAELLNRHRSGSAIALDGKASSTERRAVVNLFAKGAIQYLVNCALYTEGFDEPSVECVAMLRPTQSWTLYCLSDDTEILTPDGWRGIGDLDSITEAYGFDITTGEILTGRVEGRVNRPLLDDDGEKWVRFEGAQVDFAVTDQHRMVWRERVGRAHERSGWKVGTALLMSQRPDAVEVPVSGWERGDFGYGAPDDEFRFLGIVMTDGTINKTNRQITISQSATSPVLDEIRRVLRSIGVKFTELVIDRRGRGARFEPTAPTVLFTVSHGAPRGRDKHLTGWGALDVAPLVGKAWNPGFEILAGRELRCLLDGLHIGDGTKNRRQGWKIAIGLQRRDLADRLQSLCVRRGLAANLLPAGRCVYLSVQEATARTVPITRTDRPCVRVERGTSEQRVWCIETDVGMLITRRNGRVVIVGNCQMLGRGTRLLGATYAESVANGKRDLLSLDFVGNSRHRLIGPADALAGGPLAEEAGEKIDKALERGQTEIAGLLEHVEAEVAQKRAEAGLIALAMYRTKEIDVFAGEYYKPIDPDSPAGRAPATDAQLAALEKVGYSKPPPGLSKAEASAMLDAAAERRKAGLCTIPQARLLGRWLDTRKMTMPRAGQLIAQARARGFGAPTFMFEPEFRRGGKS